MPTDHAPVEGIQHGGWRLTYADTASPYHKGQEKMDKSVILAASIGLVLAEDGGVTDVIPGKAADKAGIGPSMKVIAVNWRSYSADGLREAVAATKAPGAKLELLMKNGDFYKTHVLDYHDGERYPRLERDAGKPDVLAEILKPLTPTNAGPK
jgi:predicted metalloprotease with PDZ domain